MTEIYKGFEISTIEDQPGRYKAAIRGAKDEHVRTTGQGQISAYVPVATTQDFTSPEAAIASAKMAIDNGAIELQPQPDPRHILHRSEGGFQRQVK